MTFINLGKNDPYPRGVAWSGAPAFTSQTLNGSGQGLIVVFDVPKSGTLDKFEFRLGAVTQAPSNGLKCSFQDLVQTSTPSTADGTPDQYRVVTTGLTANTWVAPGLMTSDGTDTGTKRTVTQGQQMALKIEFESFNASDSLAISFTNNTNAASGLSYGCYPYNITAAGAAMHTRMIVVLKYADGSYASVGGDFFPYSALNSHTMNTGTTPDEIGNVIVLPTGILASGLYAQMIPLGNFDLVLYDASNSVLANLSHDLDTKVAGATAAGVGRYFTSNMELAAGTYRVVVKPTSATSLTFYSGDVNAAAIMAAMPLGTACYYTQRTDAGSFSDTTTRRAMCGLMEAGHEAGGSTVLNPFTSVMGKI